jgi:hypothetical protein
MLDDDCKCRDEIDLGPPIGPDGTHACIRHTADHQVAIGFVRPVKDGQPINGAEMVSLDHIEGTRFAVTTVYNATSPGPPKVNTPAYRDGWDRIFGPTQEVGQA